jgi:hypothetical protein
VAIKFITGLGRTTGDTTSFSVTLPYTEPDDIIIVEYTHGATGTGTFGGTYSGPAFTNKVSQTHTTTWSSHCWYSRATGNHSGQTVSVTGLTDSAAGGFTLYRGAIKTGDPLADATVVQEDNAAGNETQAQITTATNGAMVVITVGLENNFAITTFACTSPTLTKRVETQSTGGSDSTIASASGLKAVAGATGAFTWAHTDTTGASFAYAIIPEPYMDTATDLEVRGPQIRHPIGRMNFSRSRWAYPVTLAGTLFFQNVVGTLTSSGVLFFQIGKAVAGTLTSAGALLKHTATSLIGAITPAGALVKRAQKVLAGTITSSGALAAIRIVIVTLAGTLTSSGALTKRAQKVLAGTITSSGALARQAQKALAGTLTSAGALLKHTQKSLAGTITSSGALATIRVFLRSLDGTITSSGALLKQASRSLGATMTSSGALTKQTQRALVATITTAGALVKQARKVLAGTVTSAGALTAIRLFALALVGALASSGALLKQTQKSLAGAVTSTGALSRRVDKVLGGTVGLVGVLVKRTSRALVGVFASSGSLIASMLGALGIVGRSVVVQAAQRVAKIAALGRIATPAAESRVVKPEKE